MTKYNLRNNMTVNTFQKVQNSEANYKNGYTRTEDKSCFNNMKCNNIKLDVINLTENDRYNQCRKRHHCIEVKPNNEKPNEEKRRLAKRKVKYDYEKGKVGRCARTVENKCEKYIVKISNISKYSVDENECSTRKNALSSHDLIICQNYSVSNFLDKKYEKKYEEERKRELVREKKYKIDEGTDGNENGSSKFYLNWMHSPDGNNSNNNAVIAAKAKAEEEGNKREQETVNDELKSSASSLLNEIEQVARNRNDNVGNIISDKSKSTATLFHINLHSLCHFTKTIPKQLLRMARISKEMLEEELTKRKRKLSRQNAMTNDYDEIHRPTNSSNQVRNDMMVEGVNNKSLVGLCLLDKSINVISSFYLDSTEEG